MNYDLIMVLYLTYLFVIPIQILHIVACLLWGSKTPYYTNGVGTFFTSIVFFLIITCALAVSAHQDSGVKVFFLYFISIVPGLIALYYSYFSLNNLYKKHTEKNLENAHQS